ncbi:MAG: hypothetical protein WBE79_04965 [Candidatus Cybelea sp.]
MKIAIVGGSAASTPALFLTPEFLALAGRLAVTLIGRSENHLRAVRRAIEVLTGGALSVQCSTDLNAVQDASLVLMQARYGGYEGRARDELFPLRHDVCGDEGLGPGGLAAAWRSWPHLSKALRSIAQRSPHAKVLLMTAPLSLLVRCANAAFPSLDVAGICELPWVTLRSVCEALETPVGEVQFDYAGVNHLGWFDRLHLGTNDLIPQYASTRRDAEFPSADFIGSHHAIPLKYLRLHYQPAGVLRRQRAGPSRAVELRAIANRAMRCFSNGGRDEIIKALGRRPTPWYAGAVAPFVAATAGHSTSTIFFLSLPNDSYLKFLAPDETLEQPFAIRHGIRRRLARRGKLAEPLAQTLQRFVEYERSAAHAVLANQLAACASVLAKHPWVRSSNGIDGLAADVIAAI